MTLYVHCSIIYKSQEVEEASGEYTYYQGNQEKRGLQKKKKVVALVLCCCKIKTKNVARCTWKMEVTVDLNISLRSVGNESLLERMRGEKREIANRDN